MLFTVEQTGLFGLGLVWEYGRALARGRRKTALGKLMLFPGAWALFAGLTFTVGLISLFNEPVSEEEGLGLVLMIPLTLFLLLWGLSWCGLIRLPAALIRLFWMRGVEITTRFYLNYLEEAREMSRANYPYEAVRDVYEGKQAFFLQLEGGQFLILRKDCFTTGEPGAFRRWMDEKSGKPVISL